MRPPILDRVARAGHPVFTSGEHNANLVCERRSYLAGVADDALHLCYRVSGHWHAWSWACISVPHHRYVEHQEHPDGTAVLYEGHHKASHTAGHHKGRPAIVAIRSMPVWRLPSLAGRDVSVGTDLRPYLEGPFDNGRGINIHDGYLVMGCLGLDPADQRALLATMEPCWKVWPTVSLTVLGPGQ